MSSLKPSRLKSPSRIPRPGTTTAKASAVNADVLSPPVATPLKSTISYTKDSSAAAHSLTHTEPISDLSESGSVKRRERDLNVEDRIVYVMEMESKMDQLRSMLKISEKEKAELANQLEEERRKVEDLQFCVEEDSIAKRDLEMQTKLEHARIKDLEQSLLSEKTRADTLQMQLEDTKVFSCKEEREAVKDVMYEKEELEKKYMELNSAARILAADKAKLIAELHRANQELLEISLVYDNFQAYTTEMDANIEKLQISKASLNADYLELQNKHQKMQEIQTRLQEEKIVLAWEKDEMIDILNKTTEDLRSKQKNLEKEIEDLEADKQLASDKYLELDNKVGAIIDEKEKLMETITNIKSERGDLLVKQNQLNTEKENVLQEKEKLALKYNTMEMELMETKSQMDKLVEKNLELENILDELFQAFILLEKDKHMLEKNHKKIIEEKISIIREKETVFQKLTQSGEVMERKQSALNREKKMILATTVELENKVSALRIEQEDLVRTVEVLTAEREEFVSEMTILRREKDKILLNYTELNAEIAMVAEQLDRSGKDNEELQLTNERLTMLHGEIMTKIKKKAIKLKQVFKMLNKAQN